MSWAFTRAEQRCPTCHRTRLAAVKPGERCDDRFHERLPAWKGWTP